ncbi:hypothetical protein HS3_03504 [Bacillus subtilis]|nr:hypothetical protein HS3_03504 [Bacillus subtilis]
MGNLLTFLKQRYKNKHQKMFIFISYISTYYDVFIFYNNISIIRDMFINN